MNLSLETCLLYLLFWLCLISFRFEVLGQNAPPSDVNYIVATNSCISQINLKWGSPNSTLEVKNYIITYWMKKYNTNVTVKAETKVITTDNKTENNVTISGSYIIAYFKISANFSHENQTFTIGPWSNETAVTILKTGCSSGNSNGERGTMYVVKLAGIIAGGSIALIIFSFIVLRTYVWKMERRYDQKDLSQTEKRGFHLTLIDHQLPISTDNFFDHVSSMKFKHNKGFDREWAKLDESNTGEFSFGNRQFNVSKNRYANVPTFDKTRVLLQEQNGKPGSTYINANFVDNTELPKAYIATQAPLPETISDFWRMVWEKEINCIVMIVNLKEKDGTACCQYWPDDGQCEYGEITVKMLDVTRYAEYTIRCLEIRHVTSMELRMIRQFHYHAWPANRTVPVHPTSFLDFVKRVASFRVNNVQPVIVHCSSGNGRTGVFIIVDSQLKRIDSQNDVNIFFNIELIRHQRYQIVRNVEEYIFIHECILDHVTSLHKVDIIPRNLEDFIGRQKELDVDAGDGFRKEFLEVQNDPTAINNRSEVARLARNQSKNRFEYILPYDHSRVKLRKSNSVTSEGHDYINASYCNGLKRQRNYVITQCPLETTLFDFWSMVWDNSSLTIVLLSYQEEDLITYWPEENELVKAGKIQVRCISVERLKNFDIRHLEISHNQTSSSRLVRQYQYKFNDLPECSNEESVLAFVEFVVQCNQWHATSKGKTLIVLCRAGAGKSGTFVALSQLIERLNAENVINVFKTVKRLKQDRMAVIQKLNQYELLYACIQAYYKTYHLHRIENDEFDEDSTLSTLNMSINTGNNQTPSIGQSS